MENKNLDIIKYILEIYPHPNDLSKSRLVKIIFLCDWKYSLDFNQQITGIEWYFNHYGPYVDLPINLIKREPGIDIILTENYYGTKKEIIVKNSSFEFGKLNLNNSEITTINFIVQITSDMSWDEFIDFVYSTFPVRAFARYSKFDLPKLAVKYKETEARYKQSQ